MPPAKKTSQVSFPLQPHLPIVAPFPPMEALSVAEIPSDAGWQYEPKWDGFRCLVFKDDDTVVLQSKAGQPLHRYFPELVAGVAALPTRRFVADGEIVIPRGDDLSFDALLQRIHPAESRIRKLAMETPARLVLFDLLAETRGSRTASLLELPLAQRRTLLEDFATVQFSTDSPLFHLSPATTDLTTVRRWFKQVGTGLDGVVAKRIDLPYLSGERTGMQKIKHQRTAECVVGGFRWAQSNKAGKKAAHPDQPEKRQIGSLLLGLYDKAGLLNHVGFTASFTQQQRTALTDTVVPLRGSIGFSGRAPGGPSRWSTERSEEWEPVTPHLVVEVAYDHASEERFRHGTRLLRLRPDKSPESCTMDQIQTAKRAVFRLSV